MRSMDAEAVLKHRVRNEQTSREKKSPSKGVLFFFFFQPICKFSGRSDKLLAAGAKGLNMSISTIQSSCLFLGKNGLIVVSDANSNDMPPSRQDEKAMTSYILPLLNSK